MALTKSEKEGRVPIIKDGKRSSEIKKVDLDKLDVHSLAQNLINKYNQNNDVGVIKSWWRQNRIDSQRGTVEELTRYVEEVRKSSVDLVDFKAELMSQEEVIQRLMDSKIKYADVRTPEDRIRKEAHLQLEKLNHQVEQQKHITEQEKEKANLMKIRSALADKIMKEFEFTNINMKQVFVIIEMLKDVTKETDMIEAEAKWTALMAESRKTDALTDGLKQEAEMKKLTVEERQRKEKDQSEK